MPIRDGRERNILQGAPTFTQRQLAALEAVLGSRGCSNCQLDIWQDVYGSMGALGLGHGRRLTSVSTPRGRAPVSLQCDIGRDKMDRVLAILGHHPPARDGYAPVSG